MPGTIMPEGFKIYPSSVNCLICDSILAANLDALPHCAQCGSSYCRVCLRNREPSLRCAGSPDE